MLNNMYFMEDGVETGCTILIKITLTHVVYKQSSCLTCIELKHGIIYFFYKRKLFIHGQTRSVPYYNIA